MQPILAVIPYRPPVSNFQIINVTQLRHNTVVIFNRAFFNEFPCVKICGLVHNFVWIERNDDLCDQNITHFGIIKFLAFSFNTKVCFFKENTLKNHFKHFFVKIAPTILYKMVGAVFANFWINLFCQVCSQKNRLYIIY